MENPMNAITWTEALALDMPAMDRTHQEFVSLLADVQNAPDAQALEAWQTLLAHTEAHFDQEDAWMRATGFAQDNCHSVQHHVVLREMRDAQHWPHDARARGLRRLADQLAAWFAVHAQTMDAALALHLRSAGINADTGELPPGAPRATHSRLRHRGMRTGVKPRALDCCQAQAGRALAAFKVPSNGDFPWCITYQTASPR
jgi:hemerythrin-like metal-binding protein